MIQSYTLSAFRRVKPSSVQWSASYQLKYFSTSINLNQSSSDINEPNNNSNYRATQRKEEKQETIQKQSFKKNDDDIRQALLQATLAQVPEYGWTMESMAKGAAQLGLPSVIHGVFPGGPAGLVDAYLEDCQRRFTQLMTERPEQFWHPNASTTDKVRALTVLRLNMLRPYARRWPDALATVASSPSHVPVTLRHLSQIVDDIWYYAGDRSPDMNWYTKRASLAAVYSATELYMAQDISPEYVETYRFLDRRLSDVECLGSATRQLGTMLSFGAKSLAGAIAQRGGH